jgi:hypothetical protein
MKRLLVLMCALALCRCGTFAPLAGTESGSETTNGYVSGVIVDIRGRAVPGAQVALIPSRFNPAVDPPSKIAAFDTTDANGRYRFKAVAADTFCIEAKHSAAGLRLLRTGIIVKRDTIPPRADTLKKPGVVKVLGLGSGDIESAYIYIPGSLHSAAVDGVAGVAVLDSVPAGTIPSLLYVEQNGINTPKLIADSIEVTPGAVTLVQFSAWAQSRKLFLNTTASGAQVAGTVTNFPVCIRLTKNNFDFSQAAAGGADLRFAKATGAALPFEIEQWDQARQSASIWVRMDTVFGNSSSHYIRMHWGNPAAAATASGQAVFPAADGYVGVWHLDSSLDDATSFGAKGVDSATADGAGIVGRCRSFDPSRRSFITIPSPSRYDLTTYITLSAWIRVDRFVTEWQTIVAKGDNAYRLQLDTLRHIATFNMTDSAGYRDSGGKTLIDDGRWHLVTGVFDGTTSKMFTDGNLDSVLVTRLPCLTDTFNLTIGDNRQRSPRFFAGTIDEVRILHQAMSADWVKLCYMNQKEQDALVVFK